jgi:hypothetical protein
MLRIPPVVWAELEEAHWDERRSITDLILEGVAIRLHGVPDGWLDFLLQQAGYQPKPNKPGRPRKGAGVNGQGSPAAPAGILPGPDDAAGDGWGLDGDASDA